MCEAALSAQLLTETSAVQAASDVGPPACDPSPVRLASPEADDVPAPDGRHADGHQKLHDEVAQLRRAMQTRPTIDQACGVLMATFKLSPQSAWDVLVTTSQNANMKLHCLARDLVGTAQGEPLPKAVRKQLNAAVKASSAPSAAGLTP